MTIGVSVLIFTQMPEQLVLCARAVGLKPERNRTCTVYITEANQSERGVTVTCCQFVLGRLRLVYWPLFDLFDKYSQGQHNTAFLRLIINGDPSQTLILIALTKPRGKTTVESETQRATASLSTF